MMQIDRLLEIIFVLLDRGRVTAGELAGRFGVSTRTIYRDVDTLSLAGIPVCTTKGSGGGISLLPGYTVDKSLLSKAEQQEILYALQSMSATRLPQVEGVLGKMAGLFGGARQNWIEVDFSDWGTGPEEREKFETLKRAILEGWVVSFEYLSGDGRRGGREVEPLRLVFKAHSWYLQAWCRTRRDYRIYKISRMRQLKLEGERHDRTLPPDLGFDVLRGAPAAPVEVTLRFAPEMAFMVYDEFGEGNAAQRPDGWLEVEARYYVDEWVVGHLLSFGAGIQVVRPAWLRQELLARARRLVANNQALEDLPM